MRYVKYFDINGVKTKQAACIELHGKPNAATVGVVGMLGIDVDSPSYDLYKCVAVKGGVYTWKEHGNTPSVGVASESITQNMLDTYDTLVTRRTALVMVLTPTVLYEKYYLNRVGVLASPGATVRFAIWKQVSNGDGTYLLRQTAILGETVADSKTGIALLTIENGYVLEASEIAYGIVAQCSDETIHCSANPYRGVEFNGLPCFEDGDYTTSENGFEIPCTIGKPDHALFNAVYDISCVSGKTLDEFAKGVETDIETMESQIAELMYATFPLTITSFGNSVKTARIGQTITDVVLSWAFSRSPVYVTLDGATQAVDSTGKTLTGQSIVNNKTWTLKATDERGGVVSASTGITFQHGVYYGVGAARTAYDSDFVNGLSVEWRTNKTPSVTLSPANEHIYYCLPTWMGECSFSVGVLPGGFELVDTLWFKNEYGYEQYYYIYKSVEALNATVTVNIK